MAPSHNERNMLKSAAASENLCGSAFFVMHYGITAFRLQFFVAYGKIKCGTIL